MKQFLFCLSVLSMLLGACSTARHHTVSEADLQQLVGWMCGDFSSKAQSLRDSDFYDIRLHIRPIWPQRKGEHWLYVEQATASAEQKPYRQRIYKVEKDGENGFKSIVYLLPTPEKYAGAYKTPELFDPLTPADLDLREGCTVFLQKSGKTFSGATRGQGCESNLRGAKYAVSTVTISSDRMVSWDQGFNAENKQVWGAVKGGYEFIKQ